MSGLPKMSPSQARAGERPQEKVETVDEARQEIGRAHV